MTGKLILITAIFISSILNAQYIGGIDDGSDISMLHGSRLSGEIASFTVLYQGSDGDGHDSQSIQLLIAFPLFEIYHGNSGDGFSQHTETLTISGKNLDAIFSGDTGDGHSQNAFQSFIDGVELSMLFNGSTGDGADNDALISVFLEGFMNAIFEGGNGDGFSSSLQSGNYLSGLMLTLFNGGNGDGFSNVLKSGNYLSGLMLTLFNGGNGDGFAVNTLTSALTLDLMEQLMEMNVLLYPNPANYIVNIKPSDGVIITSIELFDITGKKVNVNLSKSNTINVSNLSDGMYLLNIFSDSGAITKKLIVKK